MHQRGEVRGCLGRHSGLWVRSRPLPPRRNPPVLSDVVRCGVQVVVDTTSNILLPGPPLPRIAATSLTCAGKKLTGRSYGFRDDASEKVRRRGG